MSQLSSHDYADFDLVDTMAPEGTALVLKWDGSVLSCQSPGGNG